MGDDPEHFIFSGRGDRTLHRTAGFIKDISRYPRVRQQPKLKQE
jgi:hypothetical protein